MRAITFTTGTKLLIVFGIFSFIIFAFMLFFRASIYDGMYIAPDEPYGIADVIELYMMFLFLLSLGISILLSVILLFRGKCQTKKAALSLIVFSIALFFVFPSLHRIVA